ncbi:LPS O-antigen chain length determinant protein WzzB [Stutzerimonas stutzeri]|uniref:LPS O-antigen chain length determinant protein WzzB n=1 Tax=Stutzerimonas stutzeri TaxID=316 RepID=UPI0015E41E00|nr:Wzz/FepE/Etk N-terminal domain-containing protein [Stutzerimonas stutzeri]MBA1277425.1 chain-length determining protein [Stutzerimonas stutzeri]
MQDKDTHPNSYRDDEIDLVELFKGLWKQKLIIIGVTIAVTACAAAYAYLARPVYEAHATVLPPLLSDITAYNAGRNVPAYRTDNAANGLPKTFSTEDVYAVFIRNLNSLSLRRAFFRDVYLPSLPLDDQSAADDRLWANFNALLSIKAPDKQQPNMFEVEVEHHDPEQAAAWVNDLVSRASAAAKGDMQRNVMSEIDTRIRSTERRIASLRSTASQRRQDRIAVLQEALVVAKAVGMITPQVTAGHTSSSDELAAFVDGSLTYMRGAKAIEAELAVLEARKSDDPFIPELRSLQEELSFLNTIEIDPSAVAVFTLDSAAQQPQTPIKPKKMMIVALGLVLGGMLGVFVALIRLMVGRNASQA